MARYWVISSSLACCLIGVISFNITPRNCVIRKNSPKFVYSNVVLLRWGAVMFYRFIASEFLKTQLWPLASRPALISSERFYPASRVYNIRPILHSACFPSWRLWRLWRWQKRGIALSPHTRACKLYGGRGANRRWCPPGVAWADIWIASDVTRGTRCYPC